MSVLLTSRGEIEMTARDAQLLIDIEDTLKRLGLSLYCRRCHALGNSDGVRARNAPGDSRWLVECGCTVRVQRRQPDPRA